MMKSLDVRNLGRISYGEALALQEQLVEERKAKRIPDTLLLLEHDPVITLGRGGKSAHVLLSPDRLQELGAELFETGRGGDVTYHGPGQLVGYPILDLSGTREDVRKYVASLEETMIRIARAYGITAERYDGFNGTWVEPHTARPRKIGAVGVRISQWVTMHGFALNVTTDLSHFQWIVPCGLAGKGVTSIAEETGLRPSLEEVAAKAAALFREIHEYADEPSR